MKKISLLTALAICSAFAASDAQILEFYKKFVPSSVSVSIDSRTKLENNSDFEAVFVKFVDGDKKMEEIIFTKGDLIFSDITDIKKGISYRKILEDSKLSKTMGQIYKAEDKKNIISLGNDPKKETVVVFTDPECSYCRAKLDNIENELKENNIQIILTPVHGKSALEKSFLIYKEIAKAKTDDAKIKILKKYYDEKAEIKEKIIDKEIEKLEKLRQKYFSAGLRGVPKQFLLNELIK